MVSVSTTILPALVHSSRNDRQIVAPLNDVSSVIGFSNGEFDQAAVYKAVKCHVYLDDRYRSLIYILFSADDGYAHVRLIYSSMV